MSKSLFSQFGTDKSVETAGILINYGDVRFRIARAGGANQRFKKVFAVKSAPYRRQIDTETMSDSTSERLMAEVYAESVILGWETLKQGTTDEWEPGFEHPEKGRLEFTVGNVVDVLLELPELFADIKDMATKVKNFRKAEDEVDAGN